MNCHPCHIAQKGNLSPLEWSYTDVQSFGTRSHEMRPSFSHFDFVCSIWVPSSVVHLPSFSRTLLKRPSATKYPDRKIKIFLLLSQLGVSNKICKACKLAFPYLSLSQSQVTSTNHPEDTTFCGEFFSHHTKIV